MPVVSISPLSRVEGHGTVTITLSEKKVESLKLSVTAVRGFEKILEGRPLEDAPQISERICGVCPITHHLASTKAVEAAWKIEAPAVAKKLRDLLGLGGMLGSHALSFYFLAAPDYLIGPLSSPLERNIVGMIKKYPEIAKKAIALRRIGQEICKVVGGRSVHPCACLPGGMSKGLSDEERDYLLRQVDEGLRVAEYTCALAWRAMLDYKDLVEKLGFDGTGTYYAGLVNNGFHELYDGKERVMDPNGKIVSEFDPSNYLEYFGEYVVPHSYTTHVYYIPAGYPEGLLRVNTLARLNIADKMPTPKAQDLLERFRKEFGRPCHYPLTYNLARAIEMMCITERAKAILEDPEITSDDYKVEDISPIEGEGVGCVEAPRGTLIHHYWSNNEGILTKVNLIVATNIHTASMEKTLLTAAKQIFEENFLDRLKLSKSKINPRVDKNSLNLLEMLVRAHDPCFSCSAHIIVLDENGKELMKFEDKDAL